MDNYKRAQQYLESVERVRARTIEMEEAQKALTPAQLQHAVDAVHNFSLLASAHGILAIVDELRLLRAEE